MRLMRTEHLIRSGAFATSAEGLEIVEEIRAGIAEVVWPVGAREFTINPIKNGNGVTPIKHDFVRHLASKGWRTEMRIRIGDLAPGPLDAVKTLSDGRMFAVEWETGNISSTHRAINKMALGMLRNELCGGIIVLPTRAMYPYLTDRVGNYEEIAPYFEVWRSWPHVQGLLAVIAVQHDAESDDVPLIPKGTDGMHHFGASRIRAQL
ncbi:hypothetical protein RAS12_25575 [Achromobacter seleniivolatilans]|uniref:Restriction endonuclease n=1 Tax=Achromobacter seleniivolatilans TaxID=3047478 RepID=A0ABY9LZS0_9BURK|nr:hypothetical protein [Achromobacter sp. R39]WMD19950.1 hypothetical protein RAS12_25575 [Achromobacter sp. R39]